MTFVWLCKMSIGMSQMIKWRFTELYLSQLSTSQSEQSLSQLWPLYHFEKYIHCSGLRLFCRKVAGDCIQKVHWDKQTMNWSQWKVRGCHSSVAKIQIFCDVTSWWPVKSQHSVTLMKTWIFKMIAVCWNSENTLHWHQFWTDTIM